MRISFQFFRGSEGIYLLLYINRITPLPQDRLLFKFKLGRFLNEVPHYSKRKRGKNIPILVIQLLCFILHKQYNEAIDRIEAMEKYCGRYLKGSSCYRSNCFIRMTLQIPISGFHKNRVITRTASYLKRLRSVPINMANRTHEVEIIPYEDLWEIILESLTFSFFKNRKISQFRSFPVEKN